MHCNGASSRLARDVSEPRPDFPNRETLVVKLDKDQANDETKHMARR